MAKLTAKQEAFAQEVVLNGGKKSDAYKKHYSVSGMNSASISVEADKLYNNPKVSLRIKELQEKAKKKADKEFIWTAEQRLKMLYDVAVTCAMTKVEKDEDGNEVGDGKMQNPTAVIQAIDQANKMTGDHAAIKQKIEAEIEVELPTTINFLPA